MAKKFCRDLKTSLFYGVKDACADMLALKGASDRLRRDEFWALEDISFELKRGECLGLIGRNGAGKTTLLKMLNGLIKPDRGRIEVRGRVGALIALGARLQSGAERPRERLHQRRGAGPVEEGDRRPLRRDRRLRRDSEKFIDAPVQSYSSGMQVRLGFAVATAMQPDVLLLDEVLAVGDAAFRTKCFDRIGKLLSNAAVIFVSHSEAQVYRHLRPGALDVQGQRAGVRAALGGAQALPAGGARRRLRTSAACRPGRARGRTGPQPK